MNILDITEGKKSLLILVGPPASGKSTWGKIYTQNHNVEYISTDAIRAEIGTGENDQIVSEAAFIIARQRISAALSIGKSAMIDATNVTKKTRKNWIELGRGLGAFIIAVVFEVPRLELLKRDSLRERHVGIDIIDRFVNKYERPLHEEVDKIILK